MENHKTFYRKNLPHWQPKDGVFSITICLSSSLPKAKIKALQDAQQIRFAEIDQMNVADTEKNL